MQSASESKPLRDAPSTDPFPSIKDGYSNLFQQSLGASASLTGTKISNIKVLKQGEVNPLIDEEYRQILSGSDQNQTAAKKLLCEFISQGNIVYAKKLHTHGVRLEPSQYEESFMNACKKNSIALAQFLSSCMLEVGSFDAQVLFDVALKSNILQAASEFLKAGADINGLDHEGNTFLWNAVSEKATDKVSWLLANGANPNAKNHDGKYAIDAIHDSSHAEILIKLLEKGAIVKSSLLATDLLKEFIMTPGASDILIKLAEAGANIHIRDEEGRTLLYRASMSNTQFAVYLIEHGVERHNPSDCTCLFFALMNADEKLAKLVLQYNPDFIAYAKENGKVVDLLDSSLKREPRNYEFAQAVFDTMEPDELLETLSKLVSMPNSEIDLVEDTLKDGKEDFLIYLLENGGINVLQVKESKSILQAAAELGSRKMVDYLIAHHKDNPAFESDFDYLLHYACKAPAPDLAFNLLAERSKFRLTDKHGASPVHYAAQAGNLDLLQKLVQAGFDLRQTNNLGQTALHYASKTGQTKIIQYLLAYGLETEQKDLEGNTSLHLACNSLQKKAASLLLQAEANINSLNAKGQTPLQSALECLSKKFFPREAVEDFYTFLRTRGAVLGSHAAEAIQSLVFKSNSELQLIALELEYERISASEPQIALLISEIQKIADSEQRDRLIEVFNNCRHSAGKQRQLKQWQSLFSLAKAKSYTAILLFQLCSGKVSESLEDGELQQNIAKILAQIEFKDVKYSRPLLEALSVVNKLEDHLLPIALDFLFSSPQPLEVLTRSFLLRELKAFDSIDSLEETQDLQELQEKTYAMFAKSVGIASPETLQKVLNIFHSYRNPAALLILASRFNELDEEEEKTSVMQLLNTYVTSIATNTYPSIRYELNQVHLEKVFAENPAAFEIWTQGEKCDFISLVQKERLLDISGDIPAPKDFIYESLQGNMDIEELKEVRAYFADPERTKKQLIDKMNELAKEKKVAPSKAEPDNPRTKEVVDKELKILTMQKAIINFIEVKQFSFDSRYIGQMKEIEKYLQTQIPNANFTKKWIKMLCRIQEERAEKVCHDLKYYEGWTIVDTDSSEDMVLMGTDVPDSCQRVDGDPEYNKCLLAYLLDGKNRLVAVKDKNGHIVARAVMRVLQDQNNGDPVLYMETVYPKNLSDPLAASALRAMFCRRARALDMPLVCTDTTGKPDAHELISHGGAVPFEYVDAIAQVSSPEFVVPPGITLYRPLRPAKAA